MIRVSGMKWILKICVSFAVKYISDCRKMISVFNPDKYCLIMRYNRALVTRQSGFAVYEQQQHRMAWASAQSDRPAPL